MKIIALSLALALASAALADDYEVVDWLKAYENGGVSLKLSNSIKKAGNYSCSGTFYLETNGLRLDFAFYWQVLRNGEWKIVSGTIKGDRICGLAANGVAPEPGNYRAILTLGVLASRDYFTAASNTIRIGEAEDEAKDETVVEAVSWGFLKSRLAP